MPWFSEATVSRRQKKRERTYEYEVKCQIKLVKRNLRDSGRQCVLRGETRMAAGCFEGALTLLWEGDVPPSREYQPRTPLLPPLWARAVQRPVVVSRSWTSWWASRDVTCWARLPRRTSLRQPLIRGARWTCVTWPSSWIPLLQRRIRSGRRHCSGWARVLQLIRLGRASHAWYRQRMRPARSYSG